MLRLGRWISILLTHGGGEPERNRRRPLDEDGASIGLQAGTQPARVFSDVERNAQREGMMRIWSLHPKYLDAKGLVALWRETLLALKVLQGGTRGYRNHPQLQRFREQPDPVCALAGYLREVRQEALARGYRFDPAKIPDAEAHPETIPVASGQVDYEWEHLLRKLAKRDPDRAVRHAAVTAPDVHPLFRVVPGPVAGWERP